MIYLVHWGYNVDRYPMACHAIMALVKYLNELPDTNVWLEVITKDKKGVVGLEPTTPRS